MDSRLPPGSPVSAPPSAQRLLHASVVLVALAALVGGPFAVVPGPVSIDEGIYELMALGQARGDGLEIANGYRETPSKELYFQVLDSSPQVSAHGGRLVSKYPWLQPVLARPLYPSQGFRALFTLNLLAFLGVAACTWGLARRLLDDPLAAPLAVLVLALGTWAGDYALAAWPHMLAALASTGGLLLAAGARDPGRRGALAALGAGLALGLGLGLRLDVALALGVAGLALAAGGIGRVLPLVAGTLPGLLALCWTNQLKFGVFAPFYYSAAEGSDFPVRALSALAVAGLALVAVRLAGTDRARTWLHAHRGPVLCGLAVALLGALALPVVRTRVLALLVGLRDLGWDLRGMRLDPGHEYALILPRSASGALTYLGGVKQALLQSLPWLPVVAAARPAPERRFAGAFLALPPVAYLLPFCLGSWHGGQCLNLRYFLPALPFVALLGAAALTRLGRPLPARWSWAALAAAVGGAAAFLALWPVVRGDQAAHEHLLLDAPLAIAVAVAVLAVAHLARPGRFAAALLVATALGLGWAGAVGLGYDARLSRARRAANLHVAERVAAFVPDGALLFVTIHEPFYPLKRMRDVVIANPTHDDGADFRTLAGHYLMGGRPVFGAMPEEGWQQLAAAGLLTGLAVQPAGKVGQFLVGEVGVTEGGP